jgi:pimeloyl-ACP methyl ester carboxylesterase
VRGEFLDLDGARVYYYAAGRRGGGDPIVLLHGFPTSSHLWQGVVPLLPDGHRVVVVDLLGFGRSDRPSGRDVSIRGHAERVRQVLDALGIERACVAGHDIGGAIAQTMALRWPQRVSALVLVNAAAYDAWPQREVKMARAMLPLTRHLPATFLLSVLRTDLLRGYVATDRGAHAIERYVKPFASPEGRDAFFEHLLALDPRDTAALAPRLGDVVAPTAVVWGAHDPFLPASIGERLARDIPGATLDVITDGRHFTPEEHAERVSAAIAKVAPRDG